MKTFRTLLNSHAIIIFDGAMGTEIVRRGLEPGPHWNEERPELIVEIHRAYRHAGADVIITNTFGATSLQLARSGRAAKVELYNKLGVELARRAGDGLVAGDMTSTGEFLEPYGSLDPERAADVFREQARSLDKAGVDLFIVETMSFAAELTLAVKAVKEVANKPVIASMSFDPAPGGCRTTMGVTVEQAASAMALSGADAVGLNCGSIALDEVERAVAAMRVATPLPIIAQPNAGKPILKGDKVSYDLGPDEFARGMLRIVRAGARLAGGCCGTTPDHIAALSRALADQR